MCYARKEGFEGDVNKVVMSGVMNGGKSFYYAKEQPRFEFKLRTQMKWGAVHQVVVQGRGQIANDLFMLYHDGREVMVEGYLKSRKEGRHCIVVQSFKIGELPESLPLYALLDKIRSLKATLEDYEIAQIEKQDQEEAKRNEEADEKYQEFLYMEEEFIIESIYNGKSRTDIVGELAVMRRNNGYDADLTTLKDKVDGVFEEYQPSKDGECENEYDDIPHDEDEPQSILPPLNETDAKNDGSMPMTDG